MSENRDPAAAIAAGVKVQVASTLGEIWWTILSRGVLALALAVCAFAWPQQTLGILIKLLGAYFLIDGVMGAVGAFRSGDTQLPLMQAIISLTIGLVLLLWTDVSAKLFLIFIGVWLVLRGIGLFLSSRRIDPAEGARGLMGVIGGVMAAIGVVFVFWTDTGVVAISWLIGIGALIIGCLLVFLGLRIKQFQARIGRLVARS